MSRIAEFLTGCRDKGAFSGAAYAIGDSTGVVEQGAVGTLKWDGEAVTIHSLWDLASVTKPIVALVIMRLLEAGEVRLDDPISFFLPEYRGTDKADVTIRQLLTHTSGIPGQQPLYQQCGSLADMKDAVLNLPMRYAPDTDVEYTSQGFMILGWIIEAVTGQKLDATLSETVLWPLGLRSTWFNPPVELKDSIVATEQCRWRNTIIQGVVHDENAYVMGGVGGHAGLFGTAPDLARLCTVLLRMGALENGYFLKPDTVQYMTAHHTKGLKLARSLGWQIKDGTNSPAGDLFSEDSYGHTGFTGTSVWMDPVRDRFVVLLTNRVHPSRANDAMVRIRPLFHNLVVSTWS